MLPKLEFVTSIAAWRIKMHKRLTTIERSSLAASLTIITSLACSGSPSSTDSGSGGSPSRWSPNRRCDEHWHAVHGRFERWRGNSFRWRRQPAVPLLLAAMRLRAGRPQPEAPSAQVEWWPPVALSQPAGKRRAERLLRAAWQPRAAQNWGVPARRLRVAPTPAA